MKYPIITRMVPPSKLTSEPYGTICIVDGEKGKEYYIQLSVNQDPPVWKTLGEFFTRVFQTEITSESFIDDCLKQYWK